MKDSDIFLWLKFNSIPWESLIGIVVQATGAIISLISISFAVKMIFRAKRRGKQFQRALIDTFNRSEDHLLIGYRIFPVRYASEKWFLDKSKAIVWEAAGVLMLSPSTLVFKGEYNEGESLELKILPNSAKISWVGRKILHGGFFSWLVIQHQEGKYYFTFEPDAGIIGSKRHTKKLYEELKKYFA